MSNHNTPAEWLAHLANWIDSYWQDGMRPDEWTLKEWAGTCRWYAPDASNGEAQALREALRLIASTTTDSAAREEAERALCETNAETDAEKPKEKPLKSTA